MENSLRFHKFNDFFVRLYPENQSLYSNRYDTQHFFHKLHGSLYNLKTFKYENEIHQFFN